MTKETTGTQIVVGSKKTAPGFPVRFSYLTIEEPKLPNEPKEGDTPKFSVQIIVDKKSPDVARIHEAMKAAHKATPDIASLKYESLDLILRDGDNPKENKKDAEHLKGKYFFNASANPKYPPDVVSRFKGADGKLVRLVELVDNGKGGKVRQIKLGDDGIPLIRSGDFGAVEVNFYGFKVKGNTGIAAGLRNIQMLERGEPLASFSNADDAFEADDENEDVL